MFSTIFCSKDEKNFMSQHSPKYQV